MNTAITEYRLNVVHGGRLAFLADATKIQACKQNAVVALLRSR